MAWPLVLTCGLLLLAAATAGAQEGDSVRRPDMHGALYFPTVSGDSVLRPSRSPSTSDAFHPMPAPLVNSNTPRLTADGRVMFFNSTQHGDRPWARRNDATGEYDSDIYYAVRTTDSNGVDRWGTAVNLGAAVNTGDDDAVEAISPSGDVIYFSSLARGWLHNGGPFYSAVLSGMGWNDVRGMGGGITRFFVTANQFRIFGSAINADGDAFYFATTAHSPNGEHQIWVSRMRDGRWQYPENLGPEINAPGGSFAPFIAADGRTLYFSSGRPGGYGGADVYMTVLSDSGWSVPVNIGPQVNTAGDEVFFSLPAAGDRVYLSRALPGERTMTIVEAQLDPRFLPGGVVLVSGTVVDARTRRPVDATVTIEDIRTGAVIHRVSGNGVEHRFAVILRPGRDYGISVSAPGYGFYSARYDVPLNTPYREVHRRIALDPIAKGSSFALNNVFFDYDADTLRPESYAELRRLVALMKEYPTMRILVGGHTDNIGSDVYNQALSLRRARSVRRYLVEQGGISPGRIGAAGYGSRRPMASNDDEEGRRMNRAAEFVVVGM